MSSPQLQLLNTTQLNRVMLGGGHGSHFLGVHPIDRIPDLPRRQAALSEKGYCLIVNMDTANLPGTHWLAVYIDLCGGKRRHGEVFDSYGRMPPLKLQHWLNRNCDHWSFVRRFIQGPLSTLCGVYCIFMLNARCTTGKTFKEILDSEFVDNASVNDRKMLDYRKTLSPL